MIFYKNVHGFEEVLRGKIGVGLAGVGVGGMLGREQTEGCRDAASRSIL